MAGGERQWTAALAAVAGLLIVGAVAWATGTVPWAHVVAIAFHCVHVAAACIAGLALVRIPRAAPREALDVVVTCTALGLALMALLELATAALGLIHAVTPWVIDAVLVVIGASRLPQFGERVTDGWRRLEQSVTVASRMPLVAAAFLLALPFLVPPFVPPTNHDAAGELALPTQVARDGDLVRALAAQPDGWPTPSTGLLVHGELTGGHVGAGLMRLTLVALLAAAVVLQARRHLGGRAATWAVTALLAAPLTLQLEVVSASLSLLTLYGFLAYHEVSDWCAKATGGKIALASVFGGMAFAESPSGGPIFVAWMVLLFFVQAALSRNGVLRQLPGLAGMAAIAALVATPFLSLAAWAKPAASMTAALSERHGLAPETARELPSPSTLAAPSHSKAEGSRSWLEAVTGLGPACLALMVLAPFARQAPTALTHAALAAGLSLCCWALPPPYSQALVLLPLAAVLAGTGAVVGTSRGGPTSVIFFVLTVFALVASFFGLLSGPAAVIDGIPVAIGVESKEESVARRVDDAPLIEAVAIRREDDMGRVLLLGNLTDCHYTVPIARLPRSIESDPAALPDALHRHAAGLEFVAVDLQAVDGDLTGYRLESLIGDDRRFALYRPHAE